MGKSADVLEKTTYEEVLRHFDFSRVLDEGETISTASIVISPTGASHMVAGTPTISGAIVQAKFTQGVTGTKYLVHCRIVTSNQKREGCADFIVADCEA